MRAPIPPSYSILSKYYRLQRRQLHNTQATRCSSASTATARRLTAELGAGAWYNGAPGTKESNVADPGLHLTAGATVDEGNNWISIRLGPAVMIAPALRRSPWPKSLLGDYTLASGSSPAVIGFPLLREIRTRQAPVTISSACAPQTAGNPNVDSGAVEFGGTVTVPTLTRLLHLWPARYGRFRYTDRYETSRVAPSTSLERHYRRRGVPVSADGRRLPRLHESRRRHGPTPREGGECDHVGRNHGHRDFTVSLPTLASIAPVGHARYGCSGSP